MNVPKFSKGKISTPNKKETPDSWFERIKYAEIIRRAGNLFWNYRKRLVALSILLVLTGGQVITFNSFSLGGDIGNQASNDAAKTSPPKITGDQDWRETLNQIRNQEKFKKEVRDLVNNQQKLYSVVLFFGIVAIAILAVLLVLFSLNCHFHLLLINTIKHFDRGEEKNKKFLKREIKEKWKKLFQMRVIFTFLYLAVFILFFLPVAFFAWQRSWALTAAFMGISFLTVVAVFVMLSYVFRYSLFYLAVTKLSVKKSIDCGYDLFFRHWKESLLTSLVNFALGMIAMIAMVSIFFVSLLVLALIALVVGLIIYFVLGMAHLTGVAIGTGIVIVGIPLIIIIIVLSAVWQGFVVIFWYLIFSELAGSRIKASEKVIEVSTVKEKKTAVKPVVQKEK